VGGIASRGGVVYIAPFFSFIFFLYCFFCWAERTDFTYYTPHELCLFFFNHCFGPSVFCPFGSDCPFYLAVQYWTSIFKGIGTLASPNLLVTFCIFIFLKKAGFKKIDSQLPDLEAGRHASDRKAKGWPVLIGRGAGGGEEGGAFEDDRFQPYI